MSKPETEVWITAYALTDGVFKLSGIVDGSMVSVRHEKSSLTRYFHGSDWHLSEELAIARAELMREKKIKSLENQLDRMRNLSFERPFAPETQQ